MSLLSAYYNHLWKPNILQELYSDFTISKEDDLYYKSLTKNLIIYFLESRYNVDYNIYYYRDAFDKSINISDLTYIEKLKLKSIQNRDKKYICKGFFIPKELTESCGISYIFYKCIFYDCIKFFEINLNLQQDQITDSMIGDYILSTIIHEYDHYMQTNWMRAILGSEFVLYNLSEDALIENSSDRLMEICSHNIQNQFLSKYSKSLKFDINLSYDIIFHKRIYDFKSKNLYYFSNPYIKATRMAYKLLINNDIKRSDLQHVLFREMSRYIMDYKNKRIQEMYNFDENDILQQTLLRNRYKNDRILQQVSSTYDNIYNGNIESHDDPLKDYVITEARKAFAKIPFFIDNLPD